jgi:predicted site-specific integrase-resolvase
VAIKLLSYKDLSERWQVRITTLRVWVMEGKLKCIKLGRLVRFSLSYIEDVEARGLVPR